MDWLWLLLAVVGLGLLWLLIMGMEKLTERIRENDDARRIAAREIAERTAEAESDFYMEQAVKEDAKDYIEHADFTDKDDPNLKEAISALSADELVQSVAKRVLGRPKEIDEIKATRSAFDQNPVRKVVAKGDGVMPVKVKPSGKPALSKAEQKMLKKIKQGD